MSRFISGLRPQDRVAVKPHASRCSTHQYLFGPTREAGKFPASSRAIYPSRTKDADDVDFSNRLGLGGVAQGRPCAPRWWQGYVTSHGWMKEAEGR